MLMQGDLRLRRCCSFMLIGIAIWMPAYAADVTPQAPEEEEIKVVGGPTDSVPYRKLWEMHEAFEEKHALAPKASLRFKLVPIRPHVSLEGATLMIAGKDSQVEFPIAADGSFELPDLPAMREEDATVVLNRHTGQFLWTPDIRTPGLPEHARRLGDLRLECQVAYSIGWLPITHGANPLERSFISSVGACHFRLARPLYPAPADATGITLAFGDQHETLSGTLLGMNLVEMHGPGWYVTQQGGFPPRVKQDYLAGGWYRPPLGDPKWPNDTLLEFSVKSEQMAAASQPASTATHSVDESPAQQGGAQ
jgi:hypothetical protein